jgi:hypothetical protein
MATPAGAHAHHDPDDRSGFRKRRRTGLAIERLIGLDHSTKASG